MRVQRQKDKTTKLCASAIGICAIPPFNIGYSSETRIILTELSDLLSFMLSVLRVI